jgi:rhamnosyltransferase
MCKVDILLATYNGELYIEEQILSIISQTFTDWRLLVHDDGSTDNTLEIVKRFSKKDKRIEVIEDDLCFHNVTKNFMHLLKFANSDFVMFCDQDDVWFSNKIQVMYDILSKSDASEANIVYCKATIFKTTGDSNSTLPFFSPNCLKNMLFLNGGVHGCLSMFNKKVVDIMLSQEYLPAMHDHLLLLVGLTFGNVKYIDDVLMKYRRHDFAYTNGMETKKSKFKALFNREKVPVLTEPHFLGLLNFFNQNMSFFSTKDRLLFENFLMMPKLSKLNKIKIIFKHNLSNNGSKLEIITKIITRKYIA